MRKRVGLLVIACILLLPLFGCTKDSSSKEADAVITTESIFKEQILKMEEILSDNETTKETEENTIVSVEKEELPVPFDFILNNIYDSLQLDPTTEDISCVHFSTGICEVVLSSENAEERMKAIAYCVRDVNEDGVDELLILDTIYSEPGNVRILDMYTLVEGTPVKVIEGWARDRYYLLDDGMIYRSSSGGVAYSNEELLLYEAGSYKLKSRELYFTYPKNDDMGECAFYYSADGVYDVSVATEISADEFQAFYNECESKIVIFEAKTFDLFK